MKEQVKVEFTDSETCLHYISEREFSRTLGNILEEIVSLALAVDMREIHAVEANFVSDFESNFSIGIEVDREELAFYPDNVNTFIVKYFDPLYPSAKEVETRIEVI